MRRLGLFFPRQLLDSGQIEKQPITQTIGSITQFG